MNETTNKLIEKTKEVCIDLVKWFLFGAYILIACAAGLFAILLILYLIISTLKMYTILFVILSIFIGYKIDW